MTTQTASHIHGVNTEQLKATVDNIQKDPSLARFQFRAHNELIGGGHSRTTIQGFYGAGQEDTSRSRPFVMEADEPSVLLGGNAAPNAVETVLHALASCLAVGYAYNAAAQGIEIESLTMDLEGDLDLRGFLGISDRVRPGFENIKITYHVESDAPREKLEELCEYVQKTSPVLDLITNQVPVTIQMQA